MIFKFFLFLILFLSGNAYKVLVYSPSLAGSHINFMARIADTLTDAGHNVTFLVPVVDEVRRDQLSVKKTKDIVMVEQDEEMRRDNIPIDDGMSAYWETDVDASNMNTIFSPFVNSMSLTCRNLMRNREVFEEMKSRNFDVGIFEPLSVCGLGFMHAIGIRKTITASSCVFYDAALDVIGEPIDSSYVPAQMNKYYGKKLSLMENVENYQITEALKRLTFEIFDRETEIYQEALGRNIPAGRQLLADSSIHFVNSIPYLDFPRTVSQKTIPIGGISLDLKTVQSIKLSEEWNKVLDKRKYNMLISFGSLVKSKEMPKEWRQGLLEAMKSEPNVTFIWKYESDDLSWAESAQNIHFSQWVPQTALLNDHRLTAFLTHGGLGSTNEVAHLGKPALMIPVMGDQARNAHMLARHEGAMVFQRRDLGNIQKLKKAIHEILFNGKYGSSAKILAELLDNQPTSPNEQVVKYVEFVAKFGPFPQMNLLGENMSFIRRNLLDVHLVIYLPYIASIFLVVSFFKFIHAKVYF